MSGIVDPGDATIPGDAVVVIPTYCEASSILSVVDRVRASVPAAHVLVVDDESPDGTAELVEARGRRDPMVRVLRRTGRRGLGAAYREVFLRLVDSGVAAVVQMDADGSHPPERIPDLLAGLADADLVIGSRWVLGGEVANWPLRREVLSRAANRYARLALATDVRDVTAGFRAYRGTTLAALDIASLRSDGYAFQIEMTRRSMLAGARITEVPIRFVERTSGASKMSWPIVLEALRRTTGWALERRGATLRRIASRDHDRPSHPNQPGPTSMT